MVNIETVKSTEIALEYLLVHLLNLPFLPHVEKKDYFVEKE